MTQEDKKLLLKDLCARLPHGVKAILTRTNCHDSVNKVSEKDIYSFRTGRPLEEDYGQHDYYRVVVTDIKPYLFPLSSMTEEQKYACPIGVANLETFIKNESWTYLELTPDSILRFVDWCNKNHFDYRGLIDKSLALDSTNLGIYE